MRIDASELPDEIYELGKKTWFYDIVVLKDGQPWLKIVKHDAYRPQVKAGLWDGQYELPDDFNDTPEDIIEDFYR